MPCGKLLTEKLKTLTPSGINLTDLYLLPCISTNSILTGSDDVADTISFALSTTGLGAIYAFKMRDDTPGKIARTINKIINIGPFSGCGY